MEVHRIDSRQILLFNTLIKVSDVGDNVEGTFVDDGIDNGFGDDTGVYEYWIYSISIKMETTVYYLWL